MTNRKNPLKKVTILDVAREAGVSHATVSRVLNQSAYVDPEKQQRVIQAMSRLGFSVNQHARGLVRNRSQLIGVIVDGPSSSGYSMYYDGPILAGIQAELTAVQHDVILYDASPYRMREAAHVAMLARGIADGFLLLLPTNAKAYVDALIQQQACHVTIDHQIPDDPGPAVRAANRNGVYEAICYLLQLGHRRIGFITGHTDWGCSLERLAGYKAALSDHDLPIDPDLIQPGLFNQSSGYNAGQILLTLPDPPTAIFASNDSMAFGVMEVARERYLRIPDDISIMGFDDNTLSSHVHPPLTTVRQPVEQMGRTAARMLLEYIRDPDLPPHAVELPTDLVIRGTCKAL